MSRKRKLQVCLEPGCPELTLGSRCERHAQEEAARLPRRVGGRRWRELVAAVLSEHPWCAACGRRANEVDHVVRIADGGAEFDRDNLQPLCHDCHARKTADEGPARAL